MSAAIGALCIFLVAGLQVPDADGGMNGDWSQSTSMRRVQERSVAERSVAIATSVAQGDAELTTLIETTYAGQIE